MFPDLLDLRPCAPVVDGGTDLDDHPSQHVGFDLLLQHAFLAGLPLEGGRRQIPLGARERHRHRDLAPLDPLALLDQPAKLRHDRGEDVHPPLVDQQKQEIPRRGEKPEGREGRLECGLLVPAVDVRGFQYLAQEGDFGDERDEARRLLQDPAGVALFPPDGEQRTGVSSCQVSPDHRTTSRILSMFSRTIRSWSSGVIVFATISRAACAQSSADSLRSSAPAFFTSWSSANATWAWSLSISAVAASRILPVSSPPPAS